METFFKIRYEFDKEQVIELIQKRLTEVGGDYICVADGNITANVYNSDVYRKIINEGMFSICDGSWTPIFLKLLYGINRDSYTGSDIFLDILTKKKYSIAFIGGSNEALSGLKNFLNKINYPVDKSFFLQLPFKDVNDFDYRTIADYLNNISCEIIWVGLGAPKQEIFMNKLKPLLKKGIMIGVGAVFNFYGGQVKRAPYFLRKFHLEFLHRLINEPNKQIPRLKNYIKTLPRIIYNEYIISRQNNL